MDINKLINLFLKSGFLNESKLARLDMKAAKETMNILYNTDCQDVHRNWTAVVDGQLKAHISRIRLYGDTWLCHHHAAIEGYGMKVLAKMILDSVVENVENIEYLCSYYREDNPFPNMVFGDVYREVNNENLITQKEYGYAYLKSLDSDNLEMRYAINDRADTIKWPVGKYSTKERLFKNGELVGHLYQNYSASGISFSSYTNSSVFELLEPITIQDIGNLIWHDAPVLWHPLNYLDVEPQKKYMFWKAKIDRRLFKYFRALEQFC